MKNAYVVLASKRRRVRERKLIKTLNANRIAGHENK